MSFFVCCIDSIKRFCSARIQPRGLCVKAMPMKTNTQQKHSILLGRQSQADSGYNETYSLIRWDHMTVDVTETISQTVHPSCYVSTMLKH